MATWEEETLRYRGANDSIIILKRNLIGILISIIENWMEKILTIQILIMTAMNFTDSLKWTLNYFSSDQTGNILIKSNWWSNWSDPFDSSHKNRLKLILSQISWRNDYGKQILFERQIGHIPVCCLAKTINYILWSNKLFQSIYFGQHQKAGCRCISECYDCAKGISGTTCYARLCLPWISRNPPSWIPMPPVSLYLVTLGLHG